MTTSKENEMFRHILLATDGSAGSERAEQLAVQLARAHGARLTALFVVDPYPYLGIGEANPMGFNAYLSAALEQAARVHAKVLGLCEAAPRVEFQPRLAEEVAAATGIVDTAQEIGADLIVLGSHGRTGVARLMLGSVAGKVLAQTTLPVLVAR